MAANIRNTNLRFNLEKDLQRKAWEYLQTMDKQEFRSYSQVIALALVEYFDRYYRTQEDPYLETREREERFVDQILKAVEKSLEQYLPLFLSGLWIRPDTGRQKHRKNISAAVVLKNRLLQQKNFSQQNRTDGKNNIPIKPGRKRSI